MTFKQLLTALAALLILVIGAALLAGHYLAAAEPQTIGNLPVDLHGKSVVFPSKSGATLHGWFIPGVKGKGAVVLMHGVRANRLSMVERARFISRAGYSVLLFDFQAHGESSGDHITFGGLESRDAQAAVQFLRENAPHEKIAVIGVSLGGAASILASPPLDVDAVVLEMVYPTINEAVSDRLAIKFGGWERLLTPLLLVQLHPRLGIEPNELRPIDKVGQLKSPKLFIAGSDDRHTTIEESRRLFEAASDPKEFWMIQGAAHVDFHQTGKTEYEHRILEFLERNLK
jgi:alpha-beta hydrolase superfamily lysophospholipase